MEKFIVHNSPPLTGSVRLSGSKNSVLPILAATLLTPCQCTVNDVPSLSDVAIMQKLLESIGAKTLWKKEKERFDISTEKIISMEADYELVSKMRASFLLMGPLLARAKKAKIPLPGGCLIGSRPVDLHLKGFQALGADIIKGHGYVVAKAKKLTGNKVYLDFPSVGATENIMMAACLADGISVIENAATEPEIVDLANFLNAMGAEVRGAGTDTVKITGVKKLNGATHTVIPDRIEAGTFMAAAVITKGDIEIENIITDHVKPTIAKLSEMGVQFYEEENRIRVTAKEKLNAIDLKTLPYPGFPTDLQAPFMSTLTLAKGTSVIIETVFENRFMHVGELKRMGADIKIEGRSAVIEGVNKLTGAQVKATDLRAGAALIISALAAEGATEVGDIYHVDRGYYKIDEKLKKLGAKIKRENG